ncbi:unnamed protein product [Clavelina lepadiformis]|uniref:Death domain-containing protein n=1 Tax=Clavelina lepadiformis TaxID=159417 RepID=A0ABP0G0C9_CLALP
MDLKSGTLTLPKIHNSIESTISSLRQQHKEVKEAASDRTKIKQTVEQVLKPICENVKQHKLINNEALKLLLTLHKSVLSRSIACTSPPPPEPITSPVDDDKRTSETCFLPPVVTSQSTATPNRPRPPLSSGIRYPAITNTSLTRSPLASRGSTRVSSPPRRTSFQSRLSPTNDSISEEQISERHEKLQRFSDEVELQACTLQAAYSTFSQRVLVPLQTFCKQHRTKAKSHMKEGLKADINIENETKSSNEVHKSEFLIVQTMNKIKQLLWTSSEGVPVHLFSNSGISKEISGDVDCERFPLVRIIPDILQKFDEVLDSATLWLKCDKLYTENAKCGLHRAHRRYVKTERMWQETRQSHRQLLCEWDHMNGEVHTNSTRLETLEHDIEMLREDMSKSQDQRRTLEIKMRNANENIDHLRTRHRALRRRINLLDRKIEARERNYEYLESRVRTLKADQDAMQEKLRISDEYAASLQTKMQQFYNNRAAWNRRYLEKTDPDVLQSRIEAARLRIPLPTVREKTFILKSRIENLREALSVVSERLEVNNVHWAALCFHLPWPDNFLLTLPEVRSGNYQHKDLADSDDSSSTSSASSTSAGKSQMCDKRKHWPAIRKVIEYVKGHCPGTEQQQRSFMFDLWLRNNGKYATIDTLLNALRVSRIPDLATHVERCVK